MDKNKDLIKKVIWIVLIVAAIVLFGWRRTVAKATHENLYMVFSSFIGKKEETVRATIKDSKLHYTFVDDYVLKPAEMHQNGRVGSVSFYEVDFRDYKGHLTRGKEYFIHILRKDKDYCQSPYALSCANKKEGKTKYCKQHKCGVLECDEYKGKDSKYCVYHTCCFNSCNRYAEWDIKGCAYHTCKEEDCNRWVEPEDKNKGIDYCSKHRTSKKTKAVEKKNSSSKPTYKSKQKTKESEWPDPDDYDSYEDFMDEWDGYMPDGSDAEDYWENW